MVISWLKWDINEYMDNVYLPSRKIDLNVKCGGIKEVIKHEKLCILSFSHSFVQDHLVF